MELHEISLVLVSVMKGTWRTNNASFYGYCQNKEILPKNANLPNQISHCQTTFKIARFDLFGILKCQLATLLMSRDDTKL